jgi:protein gp37
MAKNSKIEWTHHTFNPWWGCTRVSAACKHCYAEAWARRVGQDVWGARAPRRFLSANYWEQPLSWNQEAKRMRQRRRVFCASMADVFEDRSDLAESRQRLALLISETGWLDWLLLTKRPENVAKLAPWGDDWPKNVWLGTTAENQHWADRRVPELIRHDGASIRFLSCEPLLGPITLRRWLRRGDVDWVIAGGESGGKSRPMNPAWVRALRDECSAASIPFHFKQWGNWTPAPGREVDGSGHRSRTIWTTDGEQQILVNIGKKRAGRVLDGQTWDGFPPEQAGQTGQ